MIHAPEYLASHLSDENGSPWIEFGHGRCGEMLFKWVMKACPACDCSHLSQTIEHITGHFPIRAFNGIITDIHVVSDAALTWLGSHDVLL